MPGKNLSIRGYKLSDSYADLYIVPAVLPNWRTCLTEYPHGKSYMAVWKIGRLNLRGGCPIDVPYMSHICPISLKRWDIYGACMEQIRNIHVLRRGCPQVLTGFQIFCPHTFWTIHPEGRQLIGRLSFDSFARLKIKIRRLIWLSFSNKCNRDIQRRAGDWAFRKAVDYQ